MPAQIFGAQAAVTYLNRAFTNSSPIKSVYDNQVANATTLLASSSDATQVTSYLAFAKNFGAAYAGQTAAALSTLLMTNLNLLPNAALQTALTDYITANGTGNIGVIALQLGSILAGLESDTNYGTQAIAWNNEASQAFIYSTNAANTATQVGDFTVVANQGQTFTLTTGVDTPAANAGNDTINGVADSDPGATPTTTFTNLDVIDGAAGTDTLNLTNANGTMTLNTGLTVKNVEILNLRSAQNAVTADVQGYTGLTTVNVEELGTAANLTLNTKSNATSVSVTKVAAATITDNGTGTGATKDVLATVSVTGATTSVAVNSDALTKLTVANSAVGATVAAAAGTRVLDLTVDKLTAGTLRDDTATTVNVTAANNASSGITLTTDAATALTFAGDKTVSVTLADTGVNAATVTGITSTNTAGVTILSTLANTVAFTGGDGKDTITLAAGTTKAIATGAGDDKVTMSAVVGAGGSVNGGDGTDTLALSAADANTLSAATTFKAGFSNFEKIEVGSVAAFGTSNVNMTNLNDVNYVVSLGTAAGTGTAETVAITFNGLVSGQSATVGGVTVTAGAGTTMTGAQVAAAYTAPAGYNVSSVVGNVVNLTATTVGDKVDLTGSVANAAAPTALVFTPTQGVAAVAGSTETAAVTFQGLIAGESVTVDSRVVTATGFTESANVTFTNVTGGGAASTQTVIFGGRTVTLTSAGASVFTGAEIAAAVVNGSTTTAGTGTIAVAGTLTNAGAYTSSIVAGAVTFTALSANTNVADIGTAVTGTAYGVAPTVTYVQGNNGNLTSAQVAAAMGTGVTNGAAVVSGGLVNFSSAAAVGSSVTFTASTANSNVTDITKSTTAGTAPTVVTTQGVNAVTGVTESSIVQFSSLLNGQSVTVAGRTVTANGGDLTAAQVADGYFGGVVAGTVSVSGTLAGWTLTNPLANDAFVTFTSTTANTDVADVSVGASVAVATAPTAAGLVIVNGNTTGGGGVLNVTNFANNGTVELTSANNGASSVVLKDATGSADVLNIKLNGTSNIVNGSTLTVNSVETINIATTDSQVVTASTPLDIDPTAASTILLNAAAATKITVAGNHGIDFTGSTLTNVVTLDASGVVATGIAGANQSAATTAAQIGTAGAVTFSSVVNNKAVTVTTGNGNDVINVSSIDGSAGASATFLATGVTASTISTGAGNDTVTGSAGKDVVDLGAGNDTYNSSANADTITLGAGNDIYVLANATHSTIALRDTITDFTANTYGQGTNGAATSAGAIAVGSPSLRTGDVINIDAINGALTTVKVGVFANAADATTFVANGNLDASANSNVALDSSTGYLYIDGNDDGVVDSVIVLTGVTTITSAAFVLA